MHTNPAIASTHCHNTAGVVRRTLATLTIAVLTIMGVGTSAQAFQGIYDNRLPYQPYVTEVRPVIGSHWGTQMMIGSIPITIWSPYLTTDGPVVGRVGAAGTQTVRATHVIHVWSNGAWAQQRTQSVQKTLAPGQGLTRLPNMFVIPTSGAGHYLVVTHIEWFSQTGQKLAYCRASMNSAGDYACRTTFSCEVGGGWVYFGRAS